MTDDKTRKPKGLIQHVNDIGVGPYILTLNSLSIA